MRPRPYYQRDGITLFWGDSTKILPYIEEPGHWIFDPPYSRHTHAKSRAGARSATLTSGDGRTGHAAISRARDFGFAHLSPKLRRSLAREAARLCGGWFLAFSDERTSHLWILSAEAAGLEYVRRGYWRKTGASPQFTGRMPAVAVEEITICHGRATSTRWNGGGKHGWWETGPLDDARDEALLVGQLVYEFPIVLERGGREQDEPRIHTAQKPIRLFVALVGDFTNPGELVYDPTMGSGTTGIACLRAAGGPRRFVGCELDRVELNKAVLRFEAEFAGLSYRSAERCAARGLGLPNAPKAKQTGFVFKKAPSA